MNGLTVNKKEFCAFLSYGDGNDGPFRVYSFEEGIFVLICSFSQSIPRQACDKE